MDKYSFALWYNGKKDLSKLYDLFEKQEFLKPKEMYIDEICDNTTRTGITDAKEIKKKFYEVFKKNTFSCITVSGYGFSLMIASTILVGDFYMISLDVSTKILKDDSRIIEKLFITVAEFIGAFYGFVDTVNNSGNIFDSENENTYRPNEYIQALFWGNYFGPGYSNHPNVLKMVESKNCTSEKVGKGWFIKLDDNLFEYASEKTLKNRKKLRKYIKSISGHYCIRYSNKEQSR